MSCPIVDFNKDCQQCEHYDEEVNGCHLKCAVGGVTSQHALPEPWEMYPNGQKRLISKEEHRAAMGNVASLPEVTDEMKAHGYYVDEQGRNRHLGMTVKELKGMMRRELNGRRRQDESGN